MKHFKQLLLISSLLLVISTLSAQPFFQWNDSIKVTIGGTTLANPWAGGLNFIQASNIDLNGDGIKDLFMFDRTGNTIRTFINKGTVGAADYRYDPSYETLFPPGLHDWVLLVDYNNDGKEDIFTSTIGGMTVYRNTTTASTGLQFTLMKNLLYSEYNPPLTSLTNLYVSSVDLPALSDIDNDGDLDIVTFDAGGGNLMEYHKNMSMELYGIPDSLKFQMANRCWGYASQNFSGGGETYALFDTCTSNVIAPEYKPENIENKSAERHSGNCEICIDLDNDGDKDFIVGNVSYPNLIMLTNGGTIHGASMTAVDPAFPANNASTAAVNLTLFPCAFYVDVNDDGIKDMLVSPNQTNASEDFNSVVYYKNTGTNTFPVFNYQQSNFLQDNMIDVGEGAYPIFFDYDNDGLKDLFIGNYGYFGAPIPSGAPIFIPEIAQYRNTGTATNPKFDLVTRDYANLSTVLAGATIQNFAPAFGDMDGDGDADMIIGLSDGELQYFENTAAAGATANFVFASPNMKNSSGRIIDVGDFAAPQIYDVDGDGKNDLVIGSRNGKLSYYHHTGTGAIPVLDSISNFFGHVNVCVPPYITGYSYPCLYKQGGVTNMLVGEESGFLRHYNNIDGNLTGIFTKADSIYEGIFQGNRTAPSMDDIDNDGYVDLIVGNYEGGVSFYKGVSTLTTTNSIGNLIHFNFDLFPNPANNSFTVQILNLPAGRPGEENKIYELQLFDVMGQLISKDKILNNTFSYSTSALAQGVYICKVSEINANGVKTTGALIKRIVIQH